MKLISRFEPIHIDCVVIYIYIMVQYTSMVEIKFASNVDCTTHEFSAIVPKGFKAHVEKVQREETDKGNVMIVDENVKKFNSRTGNMIAEYDYDIIDDTNINMGVLFKHMFRGVGEPRRFVKCKIRSTETKVMVKISDKVQAKIKLPSSAEMIPISMIVVEYTEHDTEQLNLSIRFETTKSMVDSKSFATVVAFITEGMYEALDEFETDISK